MKILHIHPSLKTGGIESMILGLMNEQVKTDEVSFCQIFATTEEDVFLSKLDSRIQIFNLGKCSPGFSIKEIWKVYKFVSKGDYDVVHVHGFSQYYLLTWMLLHHRKKFFYTIHSDAWMECTPIERKLIKLKKWAFCHKWVIPITISNKSQESFTKLYGCSSKLVFNGIQNPHVENNCPTVNNIKITPSTRVFVHAGRIDKAKNQIVMCKVFNRLIDEGENIALLIAGPNRDEGIFARLQPYFNERIVYLGSRNDVPTLMAYSDGMCLPSVWEGLPIVLLESLAMGCIPICSAVGGITDVITDGINGILSPDSSEESFYISMKRFLSFPPQEIAIMKQQCRESFNNYTITATARAYKKVYSNEN